MTKCSPYSDMINGLISSQNPDPNQLDELKEYFKDEIASPRLYAKINNFQDLLDCLERRGTFDETDVEALESIAEGLDNQDMIDVIGKYSPEENIENTTNQYAKQRELETKLVQKKLNDINIPVGNFPTFVPQQSSATNQPAIPQIQSYFMPQPISNPMLCICVKKKEQIYKLICTEIGRKWRDFGNEIGIRQGEMDELEELYPRSLKDRVRKMLEIFETEERVDPRRWATTICEGLINCRRGDMDRSIREILSR